MPFDWKSPIDYLTALVAQFIPVAYLYLLASVALSLKVGFCIWMMEFIENIKNDMKSINEMAISKTNQSKLLGKFPDSIQFHTLVKQLSIYFFST